jgi:hypothetical protein
MAKRATVILGELDRRKTEYDDTAGPRKLALLRMLSNRLLPRAKDVLRLHEVLCFLRAYPDDGEVLAEVEGMLAGFAGRSDLRRHRRGLVNSGISGTTIEFSFFTATAEWLARRWGNQLTIDWPEFERQDRLERLLPLLALYCETPGLDEYGFEVREWLERMKGPNETDATFLLRRLPQLGMDSFTREILFEDLEVPLRFSSGPDTPARTREKYAGLPIAHQSAPLSRRRPSVPEEMARPPLPVRVLPPRQGEKVIDLARSTMATRSRDLDAFAYGSKHDVRLLDCGHGLQFAYIGVVPERRFLLETLYGFLMLKNGVPVGYGANTSLFGSSEVAYTVFDTFRAGEAAAMYGRVLAITKRLFGADTFVVDPYQLGQDNDDALQSGAWWFYQKLGFQPREPGLLGIMRQELKRLRADRSHRSSISTLEKLAAANVYLHLGKARDDVLGLLPLANVGLQITRHLALSFGFDRRKAEKNCARQAASLLGVPSLSVFSPGERLAWSRWAPLILILPGLKRWPSSDRRALVAVVRAKGARRETEYLMRFDRHRRLRRAIRALAARQ